ARRRDLRTLGPASSQEARVERAVADETDAEPGGGEDVLVLDVAPYEVAHHLGGHERGQSVRPGDTVGLRHLPSEVVRAADVAHEAFVDEIVESTERLGDRHVLVVV